MAVIKATIANAQSQSGTIAMPESVESAFGPRSLVAIVMGDVGAVDQATFDASGWTAAPLSFLGSTNGTTWAPVKNAAGSEVVIPSPAAKDWIALDPADFAGIPYLRVRSGTAATPVNQGADRTLSLVVRSL